MILLMIIILLLKSWLKNLKTNLSVWVKIQKDSVPFSVPIEKESDDGKPIVYKIKFIESFRFVSTSLSSLVDSLSDGLYNIKCKDANELNFYDDKLVYRCFDCKTNYNINFNNKLIYVFSSTYNFCGGDINKFIFLLRKGVYPYKYMESFERFFETSLPDKDAFYSNLNVESITDIDYRHAKNVFNKFNINDLNDYHDLYVQSDTLLLLGDVFTNFRKVCFDIYQLDQAHFLSAPRLPWQACSKKSNVELELISDVDMLLMIEKGIHGGIPQPVCCYFQSNDKYMDNKYDKTKKSTYLQYYDANSLYVWAMTQKLPVDCFEWEKPSKVTSDFIKNYDEKASTGYVFDVDIDYPKNLHDLHSDLPFLPQRIKINKCDKLICNLYDKNNFVVHVSLLKQALNYGFIFKIFCRVISFNQEAWMKDYIISNIQERKKADSEFEKYFYKLMCNVVFGKSMEQVRNHRDIRLVTTDKKRCQLVREPNYHTAKRFSEDLIAIEMKKTEIKMNKPIYLGLAILDISKTLMYEFCYDYLKPKYDSNTVLCYMDTDSFIFHVVTEDFYKDISHDVDNRFDTSAYSKDLYRSLPIVKNKKVLGMMKDELCGKLMTNFCALRAKLYSNLDYDGKEEKKLKEQRSVLLQKRLDLMIIGLVCLIIIQF